MYTNGQTPEERVSVLHSMDVSILLQLYTFVLADANRTFGTNEKGKRLVKSRLYEIESALYNKIYGCNPFTSVTVQGQTPESIELNKFDTESEDKDQPQTFVVHKTQE